MGVLYRFYVGDMFATEANDAEGVPIVAGKKTEHKEHGGKGNLV